MKVSNSTASVSLGTLVTVNSRSSWTLSSDIYGNQTIASKTATLAVGDNTYYVLVTAENGATLTKKTYFYSIFPSLFIISFL